MWCSTTASNPEARSRSDRNPPPTPAAPRAATRTCAAQPAPAPAPARSPRNPTWRNAPLEQRGHGWSRVDRLEAAAAGHGVARREARGTGRSASRVWTVRPMDGREWIGSKPPLPVMAWRAAKRAEQDVPQKKRSRPISRVLSWTTIPLGHTSPCGSSDQPGDDAGHVMVPLFGLAPGGVCRAGPLPDSRCALTAPFHPCLIQRRPTCLAAPGADGHRRSALCCTFRRLAPPRRYLAPCPVEPGLSSALG